ncbi:MAG: MerR family transcriptional regulator [Actinomyces sp.]|nr:MAG: MerR family transcriptional regulator [Actinomyces sp.]
MTEQGFSGSTAARIVGISYRQLDYWARTDLVRPSLAEARGSGSRRRYAYTDLVELKIVKSLLDAGMALPKVRKVFTYLRERLGADVRAANLVIDGNTPILVTDDDELIDVLRAGQGVLNILPLGSVTEEVDRAITELGHTRAGAGEAEGGAEAVAS